MLRMGAVRRSNSPWASAVVLVCKKDGALRFCIDLRKLNERMVRDAYSLPQIEDSLDVLNGFCIFMYACKGEKHHPFLKGPSLIDSFVTTKLLF